MYAFRLSFPVSDFPTLNKMAERRGLAPSVTFCFNQSERSFT